MPSVQTAEYNPAGLTVDELDRQYNARASVPDWQVYLDAYQEGSRQARETLACDAGVPYGPHLDETLDVFPGARPDSPVFVFIHGGYWRALSKDDSSFMAPALHQAGATVVVVNYALAPAVSLDTIVQQCRRALAWVYRHIGGYNGNPDRIHVCGHSAGGHLAGMLLAAGWHDLFGVPDSVIHSVSSVSGLFDLRPLVHTHVNDWLSLDVDTARTFSPLFHRPVRPCPAVLAWGGLESAEFRRQSQLYANALRNADAHVSLLEVPATNHFSVLQQLCIPDSALSRAVCQAMGLRGGA